MGASSSNISIINEPTSARSQDSKQIVLDDWKTDRVIYSFSFTRTGLYLEYYFFQE